MTATAPSTSVASGALPVLSVESLLRRLPAEARARVTWARKPIEDGLMRLRREPVTEELAAEVTRQLWKPVQSITGVFWESLGANREQWRAALMEDLKQEERRLKVFLGDEDACDTLDWVLGFERSLFDYLFVVMSPAPRAAWDAEAVDKLAEQPDFQPLLRGQVALMAAAEAANANDDAPRARDLLDMAFLDLLRARNLLRRHSLWFSAFPHETADERRLRLATYAGRLRSALTAEDWHVLENARVRDLR